jgi:hypothetical protein
VLKLLSEATVDGVSRSAARGVLVFSRHGYDVFAGFASVKVRPFELKGTSRSGADRRIKGYVASVAKITLVALDNEFLAQPTFSYAQALPQIHRILEKEQLIRHPQRSGRAVK